MLEFVQMNPENTIKSLIPDSIIGLVPLEKKEYVAGRIVECFRAANPDLFDAVGKMDSLPEETAATYLVKVKEAALAEYKAYLASMA